MLSILMKNENSDLFHAYCFLSSIEKTVYLMFSIFIKNEHTCSGLFHAYCLCEALNKRFI